MDVSKQENVDSNSFKYSKAGYQCDNEIMLKHSSYLVYLKVRGSHKVLLVLRLRNM